MPFNAVFPSACGATYDIHEVRVACERCGDLLDVAYDWDRAQPPRKLCRSSRLCGLGGANRRCYSGVWRFHQLLPFCPPNQIVTVGEGQTLFQQADAVARYVGLKPGRLFLQYEGMNPSGSFKDNGMSAAFTHARMTGAQRAACASTGNTSASLAMYCAVTRLMKAVIFIGSGKISYGKLSQALDYGALTVQIAGDFDDAMMRVREVCSELGIYLVNSINPFRLEGQKSIMFRVLEALRWEPPDWIVVPGGNLGNSSAFGKAFAELQSLGTHPADAASGGDQCGRCRHAVPAVRPARHAVERRQSADGDRGRVLRADGCRPAEGVDDRQCHRDQSSGQFPQVPPCAGGL